MGREAALTIIRHCAGREILVRAIPRPEDETSKLIGIEAAQAIADELLGDVDEGGRHFHVNQPISFARMPESDEVPENEVLGVALEDHALTGIPGQLERLCGRDMALKIVAHYGGSTLHVPVKPGTSSRLTRLVGQEVAQAIIDEFGGTRGFTFHLQSTAARSFAANSA